MPNVPDSLTVPAVAVAPARPLVLETRAWMSERGAGRDAGSFPVLAIGWYGEQTMNEPFAYLVFDKIHHEIFWVAQSQVERIVSVP